MYNNFTEVILVIFILQLLLFFLGTMISLKNPLVNGAGRKLPISVRLYLSISLAFTAFFIAYNNKAINTASYSTFVFIGMFSSLIGDLFMAKLIRIKNRLVGGIIFFSLAHGFYITAYIKTMYDNNIMLSRYIFLSISIFLLFYMVSLVLCLKKLIKLNINNVAVLTYTSIIFTMGVFAFSLAVSLGSKWWITFIGALLFMISDSIIALTEIWNIRLKNTGLWVWLTYVAAQIGIIYSVLIPI